ncbi:MAG: NAD(P)-binding protein, partial [Dehalococcoidia bacterium]|nr:NAD(P)-binding protein [Dehalococcoidia bacterium]
MTNQPKLAKLFEPIRIGKLEIKNRIVMPAMANALATEDGYVNDQLLAYFEARARGGAGLITVGFTCIDFPRGTEGPRRLAIDHDKYLPGLTSLTQTIKKHGARVAIQLNHAGGAALHSLTGFQPIAPSPIICRPGGDVCRALTVDEIGQMVQLFVRAAERAVKAGFEAIEIHAATGYLLNEFLSPYYNRRKDSYGGSLENRARFLMEVVKTVRDRVGRDYPLLVRLNGREYIGNAGITIEHTCQLAPMLEREGVNAINVTQYGFIYPFAKTEEPPGAYLYLAEAVKKAVNIPVIAVGRITPEVGERALLEGKADLVAIARGLLADPDLPNKAAAGRLDDIVPCITCLTCGALSLMGMAGCSVNPSVGKERDHQLAPAQKPKRVLVVGGGPAGMETARVAALRGHRVTLYEREAKLGGRLRPGWTLRLATGLVHETNV